MKSNKPSNRGEKKVGKKLVMDKGRNITWQVNQALIQDAYLKLIIDLKRCPTRLEIEKETGLSDTTIDKHIKEFQFEPTNESLRLLTPDVIASIYKSARKGNAASQKLWLILFEGFSERLEHTGKDGVPLVTGIKVEIINDTKSKSK